MNEKRKQLLLETFPPGTRLELIEMHDDPRPIIPGTKGTVKSIDDICQIHVNWDDGRVLAVNDEVDTFRIIERGTV